MSEARNQLPSAHDFRSSARTRNTSERITCVVNPKAQAGKAGARLGILERALDRAFERWELRCSEGPGHATELAAQAIEGGADIIAAVGGDGTCNEVVNGFFVGRVPRSRKAAFAVVPWGTGSDLPRSVAAPRDLDEALWVASTGMTLPTDVGVCRLTTEQGPVDRIFLNVAGCGANGDVVHRVNLGSKRLGGRITFYQATVGTLLNYRPGPVSVRWEGPDGPGEWEGVLLSAFIANGAWCGGGMNVGRGGSMHDGLLDLVLLPDKGSVRNVAESWRLYNGTVWKVSGARRAYATEVHFEARHDDPVRLDIDGEQPGTLPASFAVLPRSLQVRGGWLRSPLLREEREIWRPERG